MPEKTTTDDPTQDAGAHVSVTPPPPDAAVAGAAWIGVVLARLSVSVDDPGCCGHLRRLPCIAIAVYAAERAVYPVRLRETVISVGTRPPHEHSP